jgi:hypothetical protein
MKGKLLWRHRRGSEADPIQKLECGCKVWCYDGTVVRHCKKHKKIKQEQLVSWRKSFEEILEEKLEVEK